MAPATRVSSSSMKMQFSEALGAQAPLGFWDPLGLLKDADQERFDRLRYVRFADCNFETVVKLTLMFNNYSINFAS